MAEKVMTDYGRVRGGGFYSSTSTSETVIPKATIIGSMYPLTEDTIVNANGDRLEIIGVSDTEYTVRKYGSLRGDTGATGVGIRTMITGNPALDGEYTVTPINVTLTDGSKTIYTVFVRNGQDGHDPRIDGILNGSTVVPSATRAEEAVTASDYANAGTIKTKFDEIEMRLTNLGFKEGYILKADGNATSYKVSRQGNYVIGSYYLGSIVDRDETMSDGYYERLIGVLPENFRPKEVIPLNIFGYYETFSAIDEPTEVHYKGKIELSGEIRLRSYVQMHITSISTFYFGFEAPPIT